MFIEFTRSVHAIDMINRMCYWLRGGSSVNRQQPGWLCSFMILRAFLRHRAIDPLHGGELAADDALRCLPPLWRAQRSAVEQLPSKAVIRTERTISVAHLLELVRVLADIPNFLSLCVFGRFLKPSLDQAESGPGKGNFEEHTEELEA